MYDLYSLSDLITIVISRDDVESQNIGPTLSILKDFIKTPHSTKNFMEKLSIAFDGYNNDKRELDEIPEVRDFVHKLDEEFPYWLFFLSKKTFGLQCIAWCFLLPYLNENVSMDIHKKELYDLLIKRWIPAMNWIGNYAGLKESELNDLTDRVLNYLTEGISKK